MQLVKQNDYLSCLMDMPLSIICVKTSTPVIGSPTRKTSIRQKSEKSSLCNHWEVSISKTWFTLVSGETAVGSKLKGRATAACIKALVSDSSTVSRNAFQHSDMRNAWQEVEHCLSSHTTPQSEILNVQQAIFSTDTSRALALLKTNHLFPIDSVILTDTSHAD